LIHDIYHDECKEGGYWHGFLFVPRPTRAELLGLLNRARENTEYQGHLHYVDIGKKAKPHHQKYITTEAWTSIGCNSLQQQKLRKYPPIVLLGRKPAAKIPPEYRPLTSLLRCKFVLFRENDNHRGMYEGMSQLQCIETTFRMAIKGGIHKLFNESDPITIGNVFIDGKEQYIGMFGRNFSINRTLQRLARERRDYISFVDGPQLIPQRSDHNLIEQGQDPNDSHLLQLCDVLIGGFRFHSCSGDRNHPRHEMSHHCKLLLEHEQDNSARMAQSRYHNGFSLQQAWIENNEWTFAPLIPAITSAPHVQLSFSCLPTLSMDYDAGVVPDPE
jgi:hypothetical protein